MDTVTELTDQLGKLTARIDAAVGVMQEAKGADEARWQAADTERKEAAEALGEIKAKIATAEREAATAAALEEWNALKASTRAPSKASIVGNGAPLTDGYQKGDWLTALLDSHSNDPETYQAAKAKLASLGSRFQPVPAESKATLGLTDATGGFIIPNNLVADLAKPPGPENIYRSLLTVVNGITGTGVDQPYRSSLPARATVIAPGSLKENLDLSYANYSATLYTIARIYDLSTRFVRTSAGAAEQDVLQELRSGIMLGEAYYVLSGAGTTEPHGIITAIADAAPTYNTTFTASATALTGSIARGVAACAGDLAARGHSPTAAILNPADYWTMFAQGSDAAGFWGGNAFSLTPDGTVRVFGVPVYWDRNLTADQMIVGNFKAAKLFIGADYRVDTNTQSGSRWDYNLIGFRGEEDIAFDARAAVAVGAFQRITNLIA